MQGIGTIIIGAFGMTKTPADLPTDGFIPFDWDAPGVPVSDTVMEIGQALHFHGEGFPAHPQIRHAFSYVGLLLHPTAWIDYGNIGGPTGPTGESGPIGMTGPTPEEVWIGIDMPDPMVHPVAELWFDTDDSTSMPSAEYPPGGRSTRRSSNCPTRTTTSAGPGRT